jgi:broad specificity phosphatase PhoE
MTLLPADDTCWCYLVRHGATANNAARPPRLQGRRTDPGLSEEGIEQAAMLGGFLAEDRIDAVYASPLLRTRETATAVAEAHEAPIEIADGLIEVDVGQWESMAWDDIQRAHPEAYERFMADASVHPYLGGENLSTVQARVVPVIEKILAANAGRIIVVVAHNVVNRCYLAHQLALPLARYRNIPQDNCGVNLLHHRDGKTKVVTINGVSHLDAVD